MIRVSCACGAKLKADDDRAGREFDCPKCGARVLIPSLQSSTEVGDIDEQYEPDPEPPRLPATIQATGRDRLNRGQMIFLAVLATMPSLLLLVGMVVDYRANSDLRSVATRWAKAET